MRRRRQGRGSRVAWALALACAALALHAGTLDRVGVTWDEPAYFESVSRIRAWTAGVVAGPERVSRLSAGAIEQAWNWSPYHNPHPPLYKQAMAATGAAFGGWLGEIPAMRLASLGWFALLVGAVVYAGARAWGTLAGVAAGAALLLMPRVVGHAHIAATDMPLTALFFVASVGLLLWLREGRLRWGVIGALACGLAMATKFTGYLVLVPVAAWAVLDRGIGRRGEAEGRGRGWLPMVAGTAGLLVLALGVSVASNPLAWHDPAGYVAGLFRDSLARDRTIPIWTMYFGRAYDFELPWHHAVVMTAITVPLGILALAAWGGVRAAAGLGRDALGSLCLVQLAFFWGLMALPSSPNHDGVRLFLPLFPFLALLAGRGAAAGAELLRERLEGRALRLAWGAAALLAFYPALLQLGAARPYYLSYYNEAVGGTGGAAVRGMEVTYWYDAVTPAFLAELDRSLPPGAKMATFPTREHFVWLQSRGLLRKDIEIVDVLPAPYFLQLARTAVFDSVQWRLYRRARPVRAVTLDGVTLAALYAWERADAERIREVSR